MGLRRNYNDEKRRNILNSGKLEFLRRLQIIPDEPIERVWRAYEKQRENPIMEKIEGIQKSYNTLNPTI